MTSLGPTLGTLRRAADQLLGQLAHGDMGCTIYEVASVARVPHWVADRPAFPGLLQWLAGQQADDGGWKSGPGSSSARVLATLASIVALSEHDAAGVETQRSVARFIERNWSVATSETEPVVGFEVLSAVLVQEAMHFGLPLSDIAKDAESMRTEKLARFPVSHFYEPTASASYSLECLGASLDIESAHGLELSDGSIAGSPSATAYYLRMTGKEDAFHYLGSLVSTLGVERIGCAYPTDLYERLWVMNSLRRAGLLNPARSASHIQHVREAWTDRGIGWSNLHPLVDVDETAVGLVVLGAAEATAKASVLEHFHDGVSYRTYPTETSPSAAAIAHVLEALLRLGVGPPQRASAVASELWTLLRADGLWIDKWHVSPFYATAEAVMALLPTNDDRLQKVVDKMCNQQRPDGGWGYGWDSTVEETAYCVQALCLFRSAGGSVPASVLEAAKARLVAGLEEPINSYPGLWLGKDNYCPRLVVRGALVAALGMLCETDEM